jgi:S-DNA-T family DNA segregation ATPase FtsK/SpoIIIE
MKNRYKQAIDNKKRRPLSIQMRYRLREGLFLVMVACALFLFISLFTYHTEDPGWSSTGFGNPIHNAGGRLGAWTSDIFLSLFGIVSYFFPFLILLCSWVGLQNYYDHTIRRSREWIYKFIGWVLLMASSCALVNFYLSFKTTLPTNTGGIVGDLLGKNFSLLLSRTGSTLFFMTILLCGITLVTGLSWLGVIDIIGEYIYRAWNFLFRKISSPIVTSLNDQSKTEPSLDKAIDKIIDKTIDKTIDKAILIQPDELNFLTATSVSKPPKLSPPLIVKKLETNQNTISKMESQPQPQMLSGSLPPITLLNPSSPHADKPFSHVSFDELSKLVEVRLADFGVEVQVVAVHPGPVVTRFELELAPGIKVSKIIGLAKDIARSLSVISVRIVDVIPGKSVIGLEIPNENREIVSLRDIIESERYNQSHSALSLVLGKDISGQAIVVDLAKMPHLLVAGTTGSGKSISLNAMLLSMLYKSTPEQMRLILIDPKMLELSLYDDIPHLLTPVITDMKDAANALRWCVAEMDKRYRLLASLGVRNIANYNQKVTDAIKQGQPITMPGKLVIDEASAKTQLTPLPLIVVIADELADMMMVVGKKVEDLIARIAQKARAAGIHLILATQRPSVDVITGLIKANIPTRIAFQVSSRIDSRTILDQQGAEQLLGHGDMLYLPPGAGVPIRVHGAYVADEEVHRVVAAWRTYGQPVYLEEITEVSSDTEGADTQETGERDPLYDEAVRIVMDSKRASISLVQRKLRIGYNRAARIIEEMELAGIVSSIDHSGSREILVATTIQD